MPTVKDIIIENANMKFYVWKPKVYYQVMYRESLQSSSKQLGAFKRKKHAYIFLRAVKEDYVNKMLGGDSAHEIVFDEGEIEDAQETNSHSQ